MLRYVGRHLSQRLAPHRSYSAGQKLHGYTITSVDDVPDFNCTSIELIHDATGARHCHVQRDDSNNSFTVAFPTTPMDDTGVAHILEHTALCGSDQYPVRDPFFKMLTRSFATFMNAMTAPDFTLYPFSTQNKQDFYNLLSVYCDAAFFPRLDRRDFLQEGWRLEHGPQDKLQFKGVVFNEMKGYTNNSGYAFTQAILQNLLPSHTYGNNSGGRPLAIPGLSHEELVAFHRSHYHPTNATFYTYGDLPLEGHLERVGAVLAAFQPIEPNPLVPSEPEWTEPRRIEIRGPHDPSLGDRDNITVAVSYKLTPLTDRYHALALSILTEVLTEGAQSRFYQALIKSELGSDFAPGTGLNSYTKDTYFTIGLKGVTKENVPKVLEAIDGVWEAVCEEGVDEEELAAVLHQLEISKKHQSTSFGLHLGMGLLGSWLHGCKPADYLQLNTHLARFKELEGEEGGHLKDLAGRFFRDNTHRLTTVMLPDREYGEKLQAEEEQLLEHKTANLTEQDESRIRAEAADLAAAQDTAQDLSCLPCITLGDVSAEPMHYPVERTTIHGVPVQVYTGPTNGVTYFRCVVRDTDLAAEQRSVLPLYTSILSEVGAKGRSYQRCDLDKLLRTGQFNCSPHIAASVSEVDQFRVGTLLSSYCLNSNTPFMTALWQNLLDQPHFHESDRIKTLLESQVASQKDTITQSGHQYAMTRSRSHLSPLGELTEQLGGFSQDQLVQRYNNGDIQELISEVTGTHIVNMDRSLMGVAINTTPDQVDEVVEALAELLRKIPDRVSSKEYGIDTRPFTSISSVNEFVEVRNLGVNFCSRSFRGAPLAHPDSPKLSVLAALLSSKFLHKEIREKGGAYGSGCQASNQAISFFSYRDPNNTATLDVFGRAAAWAAEGSFTEQQLAEAQISVMGKQDAPVAPGSRGIGQFLGGMDLDQRRAFRAGVLSVTKSEIMEVAGKYLSPDNLHGDVVVGAETETPKFTDLGYLINTFGESS